MGLRLGHPSSSRKAYLHPSAHRGRTQIDAAHKPKGSATIGFSGSIRSSEENGWVLRSRHCLAMQGDGLHANASKTEEIGWFR